MGARSGTYVEADDFRMIPRSSGVIVVNPCEERVRLSREEIVKLANQLLAMAEESAKIDERTRAARMFTCNYCGCEQQYERCGGCGALPSPPATMLEASINS
jgi:hypothetical protein